MVAMPKQNVPALRLEGFDGEWNEMRLDQLFSSGSSGGTPSTNKPEFYGGDIPFLGISDIHSREVLSTEKTITQLGLENSAATLVPPGTVALAMYASVGRVGILGQEMATSQAFYNMTFSDKETRDFVFTRLQMMESAGEWEPVIGAGTQRNLNAEKVRATCVQIPPTLEEQQAIGAIFTNLDAAINQHTLKHKALQQSKTALMQRMFPQEGQTVPELRLEGFSGEWGSAPLQQLASLFTDGDWIESKDQSTEGIRLLQTGNVGIGTFVQKSATQKWISEETFKRLRCQEVLPGDILISRLPDPAGRACIVPMMPYRLITAVDCTIVRLSEENDADYLVAYLGNPSYFEHIDTLLAGGTRQRVSRSQLAAIEVPVPPTLEEQQAIGAVFTNLDQLIAAEAQYIESLKQAKTALLQRMFI